ncbi:MAG: hypothetical protein GF398_20765 [Chitinivibrionales bacterium]|nr:hypothetical protein [Chitinivibrionales bacterium]
MNSEFDVMVAGLLCFDVIPKFYDTGAQTLCEIMRPGKLVEMSECGMGTGGPVANTGIALQKLGSSVCFNARVGDDDYGELTMKYMSQTGNVDGIRVVPGAVSSYTVAIAPPRIDRIFLHNPASNNDYCSSDLTSELVAKCKHFHLGYPPLMRSLYENSGTELVSIFKMAKKAGAITSCDMSLPDPDSASGAAPWGDILCAVLPYVDIFLPSVEEILYMLEKDTFLHMKEAHNDADLIDVLTPDDYSRLGETLIGMGCKVASLKSGHRGFYVITAGESELQTLSASWDGDCTNWADRELWQPAWSVDSIASATGSGDCAVGGFLSGFMRGFDIEKTLKCAVCLGWQNVQELDGTSGVRSWEETVKLVERDMPLLDATIDHNDWKFVDRIGMWARKGDLVHA